MQAEDLAEFESANHNPFSLETIRQSIIFLVSNKEHLTEEMTDMLSGCIPSGEEDIDLETLVQSQLRSAVSLKNSYFNGNGSIKQGTSGRDAKDALASCQQIINVLMKQQEQLDRNSRLMKMENILIACVQDLPEETKNKFLSQVSQQLEE